MSLLDSVISFFAMVKQSSFACLGQGHALTPRRVQPVPVFSFRLRVLSWLVPGQANMLNCLARLRHICRHMMGHRRRELRLHRARHLWVSALTRARKH